MRLSLYALLLTTFLCTSARAQKAGTDYAFLFYTADYTNGWTDLPETKAKLPQLASELKNNYNFKVETYGDLNLAQLKARLAEINRRNFGPNDQVLFFFTGHGYYQPGSDNGYLIPTDGPHQWNFGDGWLGYDKLRDYLSGNRAQHVLVAFDACHSGSFGRRTMGAPSAPPWDRNADCQTVNRSSLRYKSRLFFSSGNKTERVPAQSVFLRRWLQCLRELPQRRQYIVSDDDLRRYINTIRSSSPEDGTFQGHASSGKFVFIHKNACTPRQAPLQNPQQDPRKAADNAHWAGVQRMRTAVKAKEHVDLFGTCSHYQDALQLLSGERVVTPEVNNNPIILTPSVLPAGMVNVPGGTFQMGDTFGEGESNEKPVHTVTISPFLIGRYEVTFAEYDRFTSATGKEKADDQNWGRGQRPVINVSWFDAISYCNWLSKLDGFTPVYSLTDRKKQDRWTQANYGIELSNVEGVANDRNANGYRLPSEAEWEFAASYVDERRKARFGNGNDLLKPGEANYNAREEYKKNYSEVGLYRKKTVAVGTLRSPNPLGIHDMAGNVWEWCSDWYGVNYYYTSSNGITNPTGPSGGIHRILRGGSWNLLSGYCRAGYRFMSWPWYRDWKNGFRLARSPK